MKIALIIFGLLFVIAVWLLWDALGSRKYRRSLLEAYWKPAVSIAICVLGYFLLGWFWSAVLVIVILVGTWWDTRKGVYVVWVRYPDGTEERTLFLSVREGMGYVRVLQQNSRVTGLPIEIKVDMVDPEPVE